MLLDSLKWMMNLIDQDQSPQELAEKQMVFIWLTVSLFVNTENTHSGLNLPVFASRLYHNRTFRFSSGISVV